ncbi:MULTISPECIES: hypothetical protein [unclassified Streptomyces]|uniref:hypothetical protein n=1 Tax=unclassified Streptomyces TaxID=2593676 RepID=UPI003803417B
MSSAQSLSLSSLRPLLPPAVPPRHLSAAWRPLDRIVQETMRAGSLREARAVVEERWNVPLAGWVPSAFLLSGRQADAVGLRLAAISVNCGWCDVLTGGAERAVPVPDHFALVWRAVANRLGTSEFGAVSLLAGGNHSPEAVSADGWRPVLQWSDTERPSRLDLLLATAARIDGLTAPILWESHLLAQSVLRPWPVVRALDRITRIQAAVQDLLAGRLAAVPYRPAPAASQQAARTLVAELPLAPYGVPPRLFTPAQQGVDALLGMPSIGGSWYGRRPRRHLSDAQMVALRPLDRVGDEVRKLVGRDEQVAQAYRAALIQVRQSHLAYRRLIDAVTGPVAALPTRPAGVGRCDEQA